MRFSTLTGMFALAAAGFLIYQAQYARALVAVKPVNPATQENFTCTPDSFTLTADMEGYHLRGTLETPSPGYSYTLTRLEGAPDTAVAVLELRGPEGSAAQVISQLEINHLYMRDSTSLSTIKTMTVRIDKTFNWGPDTIACHNTEAQSAPRDMPFDTPATE